MSQNIFLKTKAAVGLQNKALFITNRSIKLLFFCGVKLELPGRDEHHDTGIIDNFVYKSTCA